MLGAPRKSNGGTDCVYFYLCVRGEAGGGVPTRMYNGKHWCILTPSRTVPQGRSATALQNQFLELLIS